MWNLVCKFVKKHYLLGVYKLFAHTRWWDHIIMFNFNETIWYITLSVKDGTCGRGGAKLNSWSIPDHSRTADAIKKCLSSAVSVCPPSLHFTTHVCDIWETFFSKAYRDTLTQRKLTQQIFVQLFYLEKLNDNSIDFSENLLRNVHIIALYVLIKWFSVYCKFKEKQYPSKYE